MVVFFFLAIISILLSQKSAVIQSGANFSEPTKTKKTEYVVVIAMIFFFAFRSIDVGADTVNYFSYFLSLKNTFSDDIFVFINTATKEIGYDFLNYIIIILNLDFVFLHLIESVIIFTALFKTVKKYSLSPALSFFMFIVIGNYAQSFNVTRQYLALAFLLLSIPSIFERKPFRFAIYVAIACCFHISAAAFAVAYFFSMIKINYKFVLLLLLACVSSFFLVPVGVKVVSIITNHDYASKYLSAQYVAVGNFSELILLLGYIVVFFVMYFLKKKVYFLIPEYSKIFNFCLCMYSVYIVIKVFAFFMIKMVERVGIYFSISLIFLVPIFWKSQSNKYKKFTFAAIVVAGLLFMTYVLFIRKAYTVLPYEFFW